MHLIIYMNIGWGHFFAPFSYLTNLFTHLELEGHLTWLITVYRDLNTADKIWNYPKKFDIYYIWQLFVQFIQLLHQVWTHTGVWSNSKHILRWALHFIHMSLSHKATWLNVITSFSPSLPDQILHSLQIFHGLLVDCQLEPSCKHTETNPNHHMNING
jgi:hypothetical protein